jgi:hemoglobin
MTVSDTSSGTSSYAQIGGAPTVKTAVDRFYQLVLTDGELAPFFASTDMARQKAHMAALLTKVLGGPDGYGGRDLNTAHRGLGITDHHYRRVGEHLVAVLDDLGAPAEIVGEVVDTLTAVKPQVVERS